MANSMLVLKSLYFQATGRCTGVGAGTRSNFRHYRLAQRRHTSFDTATNGRA
jgi:hypothetical protein